MEPLVDIVLEDARWEALDLERLAERAVRAVFAELGVAEVGFTLCLMACDDPRIAALNADFRGKPTPTNVLSWPSEDRAAGFDGARPVPPLPGEAGERASLGDIALAYDTCAREAEAAGKPMADHVTHLVTHATLHLLGYDHIREGDAERMESTEVRILAQMGLCDPYSL
jgi:probable rRNA maturation factor